MLQQRKSPPRTEKKNPARKLFNKQGEKLGNGQPKMVETYLMNRQ